MIAQEQDASRLRVRRVVIKSPHRDTWIDLDPMAYQCSALVAELADEWVAYVALARGTASLAYSLRLAIRDLAEYVDRHCEAPQAASLTEDRPDLAALISEMWRTLPSRYGAGSSVPVQRAQSLHVLVRFRAQRQDAVVAAGLLRLVSASHGVPVGKSRELDEFSRQEKRSLIRVAWEGIRQAEERLERGRALIASAAGHPDEHGWLNAGNLLWALAERQLSAVDIVAGLPPLASWPEELVGLASLRAPVRALLARYQLVTVLVSLLYPRDEDLYGFQVLLMAATGRASEEVAGLNVDDVEFTPSGVRLTMRKKRAHAVRHQVFDAGEVDAFTPGGRDGRNAAEAVRRLMALTERARRDCILDPMPLFLRAAASKKGRLLRFSRLGDIVGRTISFSQWTKSHGLELSAPIDIRRLRKSGKVEKVIARRGVVSDIADDHTVETFKGHYAHGTTVHVVSGHVVNQAQKTWFEAATAGPVSLSETAVEELEQPEALDALGISREQAGQIIAGELDMGVTTCRDPFNSPYSKQGELCAVAPLRCLECRNAFVLPSNLPQLLLFSDHLEQLRLRLSPPHFHALWGQSWANLRAVLSERTAAEIAAARDLIRQDEVSLQLPLAARAEFDL
ncbi:hypothetical protein [Nonomuraea antri]|uniref:hypothetical protein n=1 Tax=Nonomuraea antri TaxID=2730852 RepID=UPI001C2C358E|nr:hypothetical protein [Nonomuraea antri]